MRRVRVIPSLLLHQGGLVKSVKFRDYKYVGDPINAVKIFNEKEVDELVVLDIGASREGRSPNIQNIIDIVSEAFMPIAYGGGIKTVSEIGRILYSGVEKVVINKSAFLDPGLITQAAKEFGSQSIVVSIDVKKPFLSGLKVYTENGRVNTGLDPVTYVKKMESLGAGEIMLNAIDRDGTYAGYDLDLLKSVCSAVKIPVIAIGGAASVDDFLKAVENGASAVAAGSLFVYQQPHNAVLISYPGQKILMEGLFSKI